MSGNNPNMLMAMVMQQQMQQQQQMMQAMLAMTTNRRGSGIGASVNIFQRRQASSAASSSVGGLPALTDSPASSAGEDPFAGMGMLASLQGPHQPQNGMMDLMSALGQAQVESEADRNATEAPEQGNASTSKAETSKGGKCRISW